MNEVFLIRDTTARPESAPWFCWGVKHHSCKKNPTPLKRAVSCSLLPSAAANPITEPPALGAGAGRHGPCPRGIHQLVKGDCQVERPSTLTRRLRAHKREPWVGGGGEGAGRGSKGGQVSPQKRAEAFGPREQHEQGTGVRSSSPPGHACPPAGSDLCPTPERPRNWGLPA